MEDSIYTRPLFDRDDGIHKLAWLESLWNKPLSDDVIYKDRSLALLESLWTKVDVAKPQIHSLKCISVTHLLRKHLSYWVFGDLSYCIAKRAASFIDDCYRKNWLHVALAQLHSEETFKDLLQYLERAYIAGYLDRDILTNANSRDHAYLLERLEIMLETPGWKRRFGWCTDVDYELAGYLWQRLTNTEATNADALPSHFIWKPTPGWKSSRSYLGHGASGAVFESRWLGVPCAAKVFTGPDNKSFVMEAGALCRLNHPNIVQAYCCTVDEDDCTLVMELMGADLLNFMRRRPKTAEGRPFTYDDCIDLIHQIAKGMTYLHDNGIVHRDLKASNILVNSTSISVREGDECMVAKVGDFGMAKTKIKSSTYTKQTSKIGTSRWRAPELFGVSCNSSRDVVNYPMMADVYSFGMLCYEIVTGKIPFDNTTMGDLHKRITEDGERPELPASCPRWLSRLIKQCWDTEPTHRPSFSKIVEEILHYRLTGPFQEMEFLYRSSYQTLPGDEIPESPSRNPALRFPMLLL